MKKRERKVHFYEITVQTFSTSEINFEPTQSTFIEVFEKIVPLIKSRVNFGSGKHSVELVDFKINNSQLFVLFNKVNPDLPEIGLYKKATKSRRKPQKDTDEDREQSSHALISPISNSNKARVLITTGSGIGPNYIKRLFSEIYKDNKELESLIKIRKRNWPTNSIDENGKRKTYLVNHSFEISAEPSESLENILKNQKIAEIDMIDNRDLTIDGTKLKVEKRTFTLVGEGIPKSIPGLRGAIDKAMHQLKIDVDHLRIVYEEDDIVDPSGNLAKIDSDSDMHIDTQKKIKKIKSLNYSQLEEFFTRSDKIILATDHAETQTSLSTEICDKLLKL